ncbi:NAD-dependent succinate-semialdehyde dehydrogenase [Caldalkalibacillus thermarum]|uniref:NAD-dependent succinate-semialdehyde dehydrogenase n=1 Tax=Caldalkalibacillus thermarum TaxID=296745 RepID=UPI00166AD2CC|nr:NAD-dependent succinate-semialdehyde dehydrogenase [Caldalkalibacillus thermarum]
MMPTRTPVEGQLYIGGKWRGQELDKIKVYNPATGELVGEVPKAGAKETAEAIEAAHQAFESWSSLTAHERSAYLEQYYQQIMVHKEELARLITLEMGKPLPEAQGEVVYAADFIKWFAEEGKRIYGRTIPSHLPHKRMQVWKQPVGVVAAITPWNFPAAMLTRKLGPALAAGCTMVIKPSGETPLTAVKLMELAEKAGIPAGVLNLVTGPSSVIAQEIMTNPKVRKVTFTGSTEVGKKLIEQSAGQVKKLSLELGGHAPIIVLDDADLDQAVEGVIASKFRNTGQTCVCANRIYVQAGIYDTFVERLAEKTKQLKVGNGFETGVQIGPLINREAYEKVEKHVQDAVAKGAQAVAGGFGFTREKAYFYQPTVLRDVHHGMLVMKEETFGPVAPVQKVDTEEEAVQLANDTPYGLAAYLFTQNVARGIKVAEKLEYGIVGWNDGVPSAVQAPFGGMKESGMGREGGYEGIEAFLETKYVAIGL